MRATMLKTVDGFRGDARLYRLSDPVFYENSDGEGRRTKYVIVSAVYAFDMNETYVFPADRMGNVLSWGELPGSFRGGLDHTKALHRAGYEVRS